MTPPPAAAALLAALAGALPIAPRLVIVVAHPDDETLALGGQLHRLRDALLLHVTDGAPRDGADMRRAGFARPCDYAAARRRELAAALTAGGAGGLRLATLGLPDKDASRDLADLSRRLCGCLAAERPAAVLTHAYEGGHPDHDAAAFAVQAACRLSSAAPAIIEMPLYHAADGRMIAGRFLPAQRDETVIRLDRAGQREKARMVACFATQREIVAGFPLDAERFRLAPAYDFRAPPHPGQLLYESWGWEPCGAEWRRRAAAALAALGL